MEKTTKVYVIKWIVYLRIINMSDTDIIRLTCKNLQYTGKLTLIDPVNRGCSLTNILSYILLFLLDMIVIRQLHYIDILVDDIYMNSCIHRVVTKYLNGELSQYPNTGGNTLIVHGLHNIAMFNSFLIDKLDPN